MKWNFKMPTPTMPAEKSRKNRKKVGIRSEKISDFPELIWAFLIFWLFLRPSCRGFIGAWRISLKKQKSRHRGGFNPPLLKGGYNVQPKAFNPALSLRLRCFLFFEVIYVFLFNFFVYVWVHFQFFIQLIDFFFSENSII